MTARALPIVLEEIRAAAGEAAALKLAAEWGGVRRYIPKQPTANGWLAKSVGLEAARAIAALYGGSELEIPRNAQWTVARHVAELLQQGYSEAQIARRLQMTARNVRRIKAKLRVEGVRPGAIRDLFAA